MAWSYATSDGSIKGAVSFDSGRICFSTTNKVWSVSDSGSSATLNWSVSLARPSIPVLAGARLLIGSGDGRVYQLTNLTNTTPAQTYAILGAGTAGIASASYDAANDMIYAGSDAGAIYAAALPLP